MDLINFVNKEYRKKTVADILTKGNTDGKVGFSRQEVQALVKDGYNKNSIISGTVKIFFGTKSMTNSIFKALDNDQNDIITLQECDNYARQKCNHSLIELWNLSVADVCILIENLSKK